MRPAPVTAALVLTLALAGCGTQEVAGNAIHGPILTIYSSLSLSGPAAPGARAVLVGEQLALREQGSRIGRYRLELKALDDTTVTSTGWDPGQTTINAQQVVADGTSIAYLGDFSSGATAVAVPLLNRPGIPTISPTSSAVGLISTGPGSVPGEPAKYYPTGKRTFVALAPNDDVQAVAQVRLQRHTGCSRTFVLEDDSVDGNDAAASFQQTATADGLQVVAAQAFDPSANDYTSLASTVSQSTANCVLVSALPDSHAALLVTQIAETAPGVSIFATGTLAQPSFADSAMGGIARSVWGRVLLTVPAAGDDLAARRFLSARAPLNVSAGTYAAYGYQAMALLLDAIKRATRDGRIQARRSKVLSALLATRRLAGPLGTLSVQRDGATTLRSYDVYDVNQGKLVRSGALSATVR